MPSREDSGQLLMLSFMSSRTKNKSLDPGKYSFLVYLIE
jgi:hypothetical protein